LRLTAIATLVCTAQVRSETYQVTDNTGESTVPWEDELVLPQFGLPFSRLESIDWLAAADFSARASVHNPTKFQSIASLNASATVSIARPNGGGIFTQRGASMSGSTPVLPRETVIVSDADLTQRTGSVASSDLFQYVGDSNLVVSAQRSMP